MIDRSFWRGRRVLLTGHTGFKGAWAALWLDALGAEVTGFAGPPPTEPSLFALANVHELLDDVRGDVRDPAAVAAAVERAAPEVVLHLAAQALVRRGLADPALTWAVNVQGTVNVLEAVRRAAPEAAVVVVTSDKCYAPVDGARRLREDDPLGGRDPYSSSKAAQELAAASHRETFGLRLATARAGNVIGGGDWAPDRLVPDLVRAALTGTPAVIRDAAAVRPWQHVLNPLAGYLLLAERLAASAEYAQAWNFGPDAGDEQPVGRIVEAFRERWVNCPAPTSAPADPLSHESPALRLDSDKARARLGWEPALDLAAGLDATVAWHLGVLDGGNPRELAKAALDRFPAGLRFASVRPRSDIPHSAL